MARFNPKDGEGDNKGGGDYPRLPKGEYAFSVDSAEQRESSGGNQMIELVLVIEDPDGGRPHRVWDYLVFTKNATWKIKQFCESVGLRAEYEEGELTEADCIGCLGRAEVTLERSEKYGEQNKVKAYVPKPSGESAAPKATAASKVEIDSSEIPF